MRAGKIFGDSDPDFGFAALLCLNEAKLHLAVPRRLASGIALVRRTAGGIFVVVAERAIPTKVLNAEFTASSVGKTFDNSGVNNTRLLPF